MEEWRTVEECEQRYEVSNLGRVRNKKTKHVLAQRMNEYGYIQVHFSCHGKDYMRKVHRLVAIAFIPNPDNLSDVNHIDEDKTNNCLSNLEWLNHRDNINYGTCNARKSLFWQNQKTTRKDGKL